VSVASTCAARLNVLNNLTVLARCQEISLVTVQAGCMICSMDEELIKKVRSELAREGGLARAKALTPQQRRESAIKASKAAAKARTRAAKERRLTMESRGWERVVRREPPAEQ
jgi:hypothetical protein